MTIFLQSMHCLHLKYHITIFFSKKVSVFRIFSGFSGSLKIFWFQCSPLGNWWCKTWLWYDYFLFIWFFWIFPDFFRIFFLFVDFKICFFHMIILNSSCWSGFDHISHRILLTNDFSRISYKSSDIFQKAYGIGWFPFPDFIQF